MSFIQWLDEQVLDEITIQHKRRIVSNLLYKRKLKKLATPDKNGISYHPGVGHDQMLLNGKYSVNLDIHKDGKKIGHLSNYSKIHWNKPPLSWQSADDKMHYRFELGDTTAQRLHNSEHDFKSFDDAHKAVVNRLKTGLKPATSIGYSQIYTDETPDYHWMKDAFKKK